MNGETRYSPAAASMPRAFARALLLGLAAGALFEWLRSPLPWMIGPLVSIAAASAAGVAMACPGPVRSAGQWAIGAALGLYFTPEAVSRLAQFSGTIAIGLAWAFVLGAGFAWALRRWAGADPATAFFAGAIGGASEMAAQGERHGGRVELIAAGHALRIMLVVCTIPFAYKALGVQGSDAWLQGARAVSYPGLALLVAATCAGAWAMGRIGSPNAWVIGPLLVSAVLAATETAPSALPQWLINLGQLFIGISLGSRFRPGFLSRAPRFMGTVAAATLVAILASAGFGWVLARLVGVAPATMILATSPGGIAEMSLTAKQLRLGVPIVTVFHVTRVVTLVLTCGLVYRWLAARAGWPVEVHAAASRDEIQQRTGGDDD